MLISVSYHVFVCGRYFKSRLVCVLLDLDLYRHHPKCHPSSESAWPACKEMLNRAPISVGGGGGGVWGDGFGVDAIFTAVYHK